MLSHQGIMQQMAVHLGASVIPKPAQQPHTYLRFDQYQINKKNYKIVLYIFIAEPATVLANCEAHTMATGPVISARIFGVEGLDGIATFYADGHCMYGSLSSRHRGRRFGSDLEILDNFLMSGKTRLFAENLPKRDSNFI
ncbi:hypothetical protein G7Y89_g809 [Cudoniella acicularis]|uniref:Uncharacterized protein n=1 Tax=Cudoniella acicularis TaxID=354080 RepID=A0A8H4RXC1_9HELO|nr:hypothetical protein G7Y89_g809 [Cudoniella acicularis]